jgi:hypothetical protein
MDGMEFTHGLAELAGNAAFFPRRVAPESMLAAESRRDGSLNIVLRQS